MSQNFNRRPPEEKTGLDGVRAARSTERRPVPHVQHSEALEAAACAVLAAKGGAGLPVRLVSNPLDVRQVREAIAQVSRWFEDPAFYTEGEAAPATEIAAADNLILLATLLREHLRAGNLT